MFQILLIFTTSAHPYPALVISKLGCRTVTNFISASLFPLELPDLSYSSSPSSPPHRSLPTNIPRFMGRSPWPCKAYHFSSVYSLPNMCLCTHILRNKLFQRWNAAAAFLFWSAVKSLQCERFTVNELGQNCFFIHTRSWRKHCSVVEVAKWLHFFV